MINRARARHNPGESSYVVKSKPTLTMSPAFASKRSPIQFTPARSRAFEEWQFCAPGIHGGSDPLDKADVTNKVTLQNATADFLANA